MGVRANNEGAKIVDAAKTAAPDYQSTTLSIAEFIAPFQHRGHPIEKEDKRWNRESII